ncbi:MAG TPA: hypothetical protein VIL88_02480 [Devosia sp.]|jgi:hypothetical protein
MNPLTHEQYRAALLKLHLLADKAIRPGTRKPKAVKKARAK